MVVTRRLAPQPLLSAAAQPPTSLPPRVNPTRYEKSGLNPQHYLADVLARIAEHPARQIADLLPWHWKPADLDRAAA
jgi:hypothetical protein